MSVINVIQKNYLFPAARVLQFAKAPVVGSVKTRLMPKIGAEQACLLHQQMVSYVLKQLVGFELAPIYLYSNDIDQPFMIDQAGYFDIPLKLQQGNNLGERMFSAVSQVLAEPSVECCLLIGSDCLSLTKEYLSDAMFALNSGHDVAIGPASDGGYVLIAMKQACAELFNEKIEWGSERVFGQTLEIAVQMELSVQLLPEQADIDRPEDLFRLHKYGIVL